MTHLLSTYQLRPGCEIVKKDSYSKFKDCGLSFVSMIVSSIGSLVVVLAGQRSGWWLCPNFLSSSKPSKLANPHFLVQSIK
ncbi:hypothetical protein BCR33DRAFT_712326 [Rhizoclosmatium globosum]|uniref:Uncharacterized protein n=1 Tax=Rhizoclosmatium globosum TaxID=329046 RepID=A0A1Y2CZ29_9FUNG|nr:hypothetical protein BCR33DRAFT_712326 [Rhizoclosmatium globosum]|eukprot:ORY52114.1 hypothetical protein BCR33DRAFT_712326 [Rhizoclosmatium globosum]